MYLFPIKSIKALLLSHINVHSRTVEVACIKLLYSWGFRSWAGGVLSMHKSTGSISNNKHTVCTYNIHPSRGWKDESAVKNAFVSVRGPSSIPSTHVGVS